MHSRGLLHKTKLDEFCDWALARGYVEEPTKGLYEVLRLRLQDPSGDHPPVIIYRRDKGEHLTVFAEGLTLVRDYLEESTDPLNFSSGEVPW